MPHKLINVRKVLIRFLSLEVLAVFAMSFASTFYFKQLHNDGAHWAFNLLRLEAYHIDDPYLRFTTIINQIPAIISAKLNASLPVSVWLFCLGYMIYPFVGLFISWRLFQKYGLREYFIIPLAIFFFCIIPNWSFSVSVVNEAITAGLITCSYILSRKTPNNWIVLLLAAILNFSYEMGGIFYPVFLYLLWRERKINKTLFIGITVLMIGLSYNVFFRLIPNGAHGHVSNSIKWSIGGIFIYLPLCLLTLWFDLKERKWFRPVGIILILLLIFIIFRSMAPQIPLHFWSFSYLNRVWAIPMSGLLIVALYEFVRFKRNLSSYDLFVFALFFLPFVYFEARIVKDIISVNSRLKDFISKNQGCIVLNRPDWATFEGDTYIPDWSLSMLSVLHGDSYKPKTILFAELTTLDQTDLIKNNFCRINEGNIEIYSAHTLTYVPTQGKFDFTGIYPK